MLLPSHKAPEIFMGWEQPEGADGLQALCGEKSRILKGRISSLGMFIEFVNNQRPIEELGQPALGSEACLLFLSQAQAQWERKPGGADHVQGSLEHLP